MANDAFCPPPVGAVPFQRHQLQNHHLQRLDRPRSGQAQVTRVWDQQGDWVLKDFHHSPVIGALWGRWLLRREWRTLKRLDGIAGVPQAAFQLDRDAIGYRFSPGLTLRQLKDQGQQLPRHYFEALEQVIARMHAHGIAHLDLGNLRNLLVTPDNQPQVLDFGSSIRLDPLPRALADRLRRLDQARLYKAWNQLAPDSLDDHQRRFFKQHYHPHKSKPKHWGRQAMRAIRQCFHNPKLRRGFRRLRLPLGIGFLILVMSQINPAWYWPGATLAGIGALLQAWSFACIDTQTTLADRGPYSLVRNPQYLTRYLLVAGVVLMTGNPWLLAMVTVLYSFYAVTRVEREEALLPEALGDPYQDYCQRVPRFLPRFANLDRRRLWYWNPVAFRKNHGATNLATVASTLGLLYLWAFTLA